MPVNGSAGRWSSTHWAVVSGALVGAVAGYLLRTPKGRRLCEAAVQTLDEFSLECARVCEAATRARIAAAEGWSAIEGGTSLSGPEAMAGNESMDVRTTQ